MLDIMELDQKNTWKIVKETRQLILTMDFECVNSDSLISDSYFVVSDFFIKIVQSKLQLNTASTPKRNIPDYTLKTAAQMFLYLNFCPPKLLFCFVKK